MCEAGVDYDVHSRGTYVADSTQTPGCTSTARADYIEIVSEVSSPVLRKRPVRIASLVNPAIGSFQGDLGSMVVQISTAWRVVRSTEQVPAR